ncbi:threonine synthase [Jiangella rhizosphaerae]|uniref:Pyridoxal-phosphate dependent enzyme n=1 Tax=Jiangella rhizosphaerae TaxID=2293569 RepID=A0A418KLU0_9ACTN|nr:pyridoxal-phosphate dependent enzyme [Jiangella rhizosphaerae]RIQ18891.1 pyridoxal-phosphate dependent enzyme [Jiangella rhizosphaerae]
MTYTRELSCLRCAAVYPDPSLELVGRGCPACESGGVPSNVLPVYDLAGLGALPVADGEPGLFRYRSLLPLAADTPAVSLAEGSTPVVDLPAVAERLGVASVVVKDETRNPTWSYKDRLASVAVTKAVELGIDTVVVASTGNHGAAIAAYAARAGLRCVVLTVASVPSTMKTLMQAYGASVVALPEPRQRWTLMRQLVEKFGWLAMSGHADPPVGSNPYGVDGYKTIAYELVTQLAAPPDVVVVPTAYADGLVGIARGFADLVALGVLERSPRMVAAEPFGPLASAMASGSEVAGPVPYEPSVAFSTASPVGTYQGLSALRSTDGAAVAVPSDEVILAAQRELAASAGLYQEAASATAWPALAGQGSLGPAESVVVIGTSTGLKDVGATAATLPEVPVIEPTADALLAAIGS